MSERVRKWSRLASFYHVAALSLRCTDPLRDSLHALSVLSSVPRSLSPGAAWNVIQKHNARYRLSHRAALSSPDTEPARQPAVIEQFNESFKSADFPQAYIDICSSTHAQTHTSALPVKTHTHTHSYELA